MKIGVTSYSYDALLREGKKDMEGIVSLAARQGYEGIEFASLDEIYETVPAKALRARCEGEGILPAGYAVTADLEAGIERAESKLTRNLDEAAELGAPVMRTDLFHEYPLDPFAEKYIAAVRRIADEAEKRHIVLTTENHCGYFCTAERMERLVTTVAHPNFGILCDTANFLDADERADEVLARIAPYVRHVHLKDCHWKRGDMLYPGEGWYSTRGGNYIRGAIVGHGDVPLPQAIKALDAVGYAGWLIVEFEGIEECESACALSLRYAKRLLGSLGLLRWHEGC